MVVNLDDARKLLRTKIDNEPLPCKTAFVRSVLPEINRARERRHHWPTIAKWCIEAGCPAPLSGNHLQSIYRRVKAEAVKAKKVDGVGALAPKLKKFVHDPEAKGDLV